MVALSRRAFLAASAATVLGGCGREEAGRTPPSDDEVLARLLEVELAAGAAVIGSPLAELLVRQDAQHARRLGAAPGRRPAAAHELAAALARKQDAVFAYVQALPALADPDARVRVMQVLASEAEHLAALRLAAGEEPVPDAFAGFVEAP